MCCQAGLLVVPVGGGPPASRPRRELRSARRLEARPGPATAHGHRSQALRCPSRRWPLLCEIPEWFPSNVARNSPASISNIEFRTLELQRFRAVSKNDRGKLRASFVWGQSVHRSAGRPSGALHVGDVCVAVTSLARHGRCPPALRPCLRPRQCPPRRWPLLCEIPEWFPSNVARNSPASISNIEFRTLELQRFRAVSKNDRGKLRATFVWTVTCCLPTRSSTRAR